MVAEGGSHLFPTALVLVNFHVLYILSVQAIQLREAEESVPSHVSDIRQNQTDSYILPFYTHRGPIQGHGNVLSEDDGEHEQEENPMSYINKKSAGVRGQSHKNFMAGNSWFISDPVLRLRIAASSCFFGEPMYYHRDANDKRSLRIAPDWRLTNEDVKHLAIVLNMIEVYAAGDKMADEVARWNELRMLPPSKLMEGAIDAALAFDIEKTLQEAARLRNEDHMRTTPQVILVRAANHEKAKGTGLIVKYAPQICRRGDEPAVSLAYQLSAFGKKALPNSLKKAWRAALEGMDDYEIGKYRMESREVKTIDVVRFSHANSPAIDKLVKDELRITGETWEAIISAKGSSKEAWNEAIEKMGHMALLRNIRNLIEHGIDPTTFMPKLKQGVAGGKQLPFRYYSAYNAVKNIAPASVLDGIEECMEAALGNMPRFAGRVMALCDNSGSTRGTTTSAMGTMRISDIANLSAVITGKVSDDGWIGVFGNELRVSAIRKKESIFSQVSKADLEGAGVGGDTENGIWLFFDKAIREKQHWDTIFVFSDQQAGHGGLYGINAQTYPDYMWNSSHYIDVARLVSHYRSVANKDVDVFLVQVAGYQDTIIPEFYNRTYILGGWGEGLWRFAASMIAQVPAAVVQRPA